jgi:hypothetical protein
MTNRDNVSPIREAVGVFFDATHLKEAIADLSASGFARDTLGLLAGEYTVQQSLGDLYTRTNEFHDSPNAPATAFVKKESVGDTMHALAGGLFFAGGTAAMGALVASAAVLGGTLLAAVTGVAAVGSAGALLGALIHQSDAEYLEQQVDEGHLLLFVRVHDPAEERRALDILSKHAGYDARIHEVPTHKHRSLLHRSTSGTVTA